MMEKVNKDTHPVRVGVVDGQKEVIVVQGVNAVAGGCGSEPWK